MRLLVVRWGAIGDSIIITPLLRYLKKQGHEVYLNVSETGMKVLKGNPHVDKWIPYESNSVPDAGLKTYWENLKVTHKCDGMINLCESIERALSMHPIDPNYNLPKQERANLCDINFYDQMFLFAQKQCPEAFKYNRLIDYNPELFFSEQEEKDMQNYLRSLGKKRIILWGLSGSGLNKSYPYADTLIQELLRDYPDIIIITMGDNVCTVLEEFMPKHKRHIKKCAKWDIRESMLACKYADVVVAPDTGILHASGCFDTPKVGYIGSNTINQLTKYFKNDYSIEADHDVVPCSPCYRIIYGASNQCPIDLVTRGVFCMAKGIEPQKLYDQIRKALDEHRERSTNKMSALFQDSPSEESVPVSDRG